MWRGSLTLKLVRFILAGVQCRTEPNIASFIQPVQWRQLEIITRQSLILLCRGVSDASCFLKLLFSFSPRCFPIFVYKSRSINKICDIFLWSRFLKLLNILRFSALDCFEQKCPCCRGLPCSLCGIVEAAADSGRNNSVWGMINIQFIGKIF